MRDGGGATGLVPVGFLAPDPDEEPPLLLQRHLAAWPTHGGSGAAIAAVGPRPLIALYDFTPEAPGELLMERGMPLELLEGPQAAGAGWCVVRDGSGASGLVPLSFVGFADGGGAPPAQPSAALLSEPAPAPPDAAGPVTGGRYVAMHDFVAEEEGEMSVAAGTRLQIIEGGGTSGWCIARTADGHRGLVPFSFLTEDRAVAASSSTSYEAQRAAAPTPPPPLPLKRKGSFERLRKRLVPSAAAKAAAKEAAEEAAREAAGSHPPLKRASSWSTRARSLLKKKGAAGKYAADDNDVPSSSSSTRGCRRSAGGVRRTAQPRGGGARDRGSAARLAARRRTAPTREGRRPAPSPRLRSP